MKIKNKMNYRDKTKDELIKELQKLHKEYDSLIKSYEEDNSERKQTEEALRTSMLLLKKSQEVGHIGSWEYDLTTNHLTWSDEVYRIFGISPQEFQATNEAFLDIAHPEDRARIDAAYKKSLQQNLDSYDSEHRIIRKNTGEIRYVQERCENIRDASGRFIRSVGMVQDITDRKKEEDRQALVLRSVPLLIYSAETPSNYGVTWISENVENITGFERNVFLEEANFWSGRLHPDDRDRAVRVFNELKESEKDAIEYRWQCANGEYRWFLDSFKSFKKNNQGKIEIIGVWLDITERKKVEEALKESEERYRMIIETANDLVWMLDTQGCFIFINKQAEKITGHKISDWIGKSFIPLVHPEDLARVQEIFLENLRGRSQSYEVRIYGSTGEIIILSVNSVPISHDGIVTSTASFGRDITKHKWLEDALRESEEQYRRLVEGSPSAIAVHTKGKFIFVNQAGAKLIGAKSPKELIGSSILNIVHPDSRSKVIDRLRNVSEGKEAPLFEEKFVKFDGSVIDVEVVGIPFPYQGQIATQVVVRDITERKMAETALYEANQLMETIFENMHIMVACLDPKFNFIRVNRAYAQADKRKPSSFTGKNHFDLYPNAENEAIFRQVVETGEPHFAVAKSFRYPENPERGISYLDWSLLPIKDVAGPVTGLILILLDVTGNKKAEEALRESEERYRRLVDSSPFGIAITTDGKIVYINHAGVIIHGAASPSEIIGKSLFELLPADYKKHVKERIDKVEEGKVAQVMEEKLLRLDGTVVDVELGAIPFIYYDKKATYSVFQDITERKKAEEEIKKSKKLLEDLHKHLTEIREDERALISREIHDQIGQSLTALKLDLNGMKKYLNTNPEAVAKLESIIGLVSNTIKDVQRISSDLRPGILDDLGLAAAIEWYSGEFEQRTGIRCSLKLDDSTYDDSQKSLVFFRVLQEALTNVIRHANASSVSISLRQSKQGITMTIHDNGIGIPTGKAESGKSLGLIGMRERVRQFGGELVISAKESSGTKLIVFIPK